MSKETIVPQNILDKINEKYPEKPVLDFDKRVREAAIWGYGLSEGRIKELEASDKWISVKDGLPDGEHDLLFYTTGYLENKIEKGIFLKKDQWDRPNIFCGGAFYTLENVSHWMHLPKAPKE